MSFEPLPEDLQEFLCRRIHSYEELEALLFLRSHGGEAWSADSVAEQLRISSTAADEALEQLCRQGLL